MSEGTSWKTPAAVIGIITVLLTAAGVYISKRGSDHEIQKQEYQQQVDEVNKAEQYKRDEEIQNRKTELNRQLKASEDQVRELEAKIKETYRLIQEFDEKQNNLSASEADRAEDHKSYLIERENLEMFSNSKRQTQARLDELRKEINDLTK
ncbi:MAG: hypothetical protein JWQ25_1846 [Daejeonella sp.]|nr:hypothetical protein [Daejeonella sp.]